MNNFVNRLFELDRNRRILLYAGVLLVLSVLYWRFSYSGLVQVITDKTDRAQQLETDVQKKTRLAARLEFYRNEVKQLEAELRKAVAQLPSEKEIPDLLSSVSSLGREAGLEITLFRQKPEVLKDFYAEVPVEMEMRGSYRQVGRFVEAVGQLPRIVNVTDIAMRNPAVAEDRVLIDTRCITVTFRFLTEEERARIAAEKAAKERQ